MDYVRLGRGWILKDRFGTRLLVNGRDAIGEELQLDGAAAQVMELLISGSSISLIARTTDREEDEVRDFICELEAIGALQSIACPESSLDRFYTCSPPLDCLCLLITNRCNLHCQHCYMDSGRPNADELDCEEWVEVIRQAKKLGINSVNISGGEPLLHSGFDRIASYLATVREVGANLNTNGLLVEDCDIGLLREAFISVQVSLDDHRADFHDVFRGVTGAHQRTVRAIQHLVNSGMTTAVGTTVTEQNVDVLSGLANFCESLGVSLLNIGLPLASGRGSVNPAIKHTGEYEFLRRVHNACRKLERRTGPMRILLPFGCTDVPYISRETSLVCGGERRQTLYIHSDGTVVPCDKLPKELFAVGNVRDDCLRRLWLSDAMRSFKVRRICDLPVCGQCEMVEICGGACSARAYCEGNGIDGRDSVACRMTKLHLMDK